MSLEEILSDQVGKIAYRRDSYGEGRFKVISLLAGAGQGYALLTEDTWCGGQAGPW